MKKIIAMYIIAIFLISLAPNILAADQQIKEKHQKATEKYKSIKEEKKTTIKLQQIKQEKQEMHEELKKQITAKKSQLKELCKNEKSDDCKNLKEKINTAKKERIQTYSDRIANGLETAIEKITKLNINETKKQEIIQKLTEKKQTMLGLKDVAEEQTEETEKEILELTKNEAQKAINEMRRATAMSNLKRFNGVIEKAENLQKKIDKIIKKVKSEGKDASDIETLKSEFDEKINLAKEKHQKAIDLAQDMTKENMKEAINLIKEAHKNLKEAHQVLKEIAKTLREQKIETQKETNQTTEV